MRNQLIGWTIVAALAGCAAPEEVSNDESEQVGDPRTYSHAECRAAGGVVVGDIGNGATQRPDYRCANGKRPLGIFRALPGEPRPTEGAVCCPK